MEAIGSPAGGSNRQHASEVAKNHQGSGTCMCVNWEHSDCM